MAEPRELHRHRIQNAFVLDTIRMLYVGAALLFFIDTIYTGMTTSGIQRLINIPLGLLVTAFFFALYRMIVVGRITPPWANRLGALTMVLAISNILIQQIVMPDAPSMLMVMGFTLVAISSGIVFLERAWVVGTLAVIIGGWSVVQALSGHSVPWNHYGYIYTMVALFTLFNYSGRKLAVSAMVDAQYENELQRSHLAEALERAHRSEAQLRAERDFADQIVESVGQGLALLDADGRIEFMIPAAERIIQVPAVLLVGQKVSDVFAPDGELASALVEQVSESAHELTISTEDGGKRNVLVSTTPRPGGGSIVTLTDLTIRKQFESELARLAHYDALTGLPNRPLFRDRLRQAIDRLERHDGHMAVMFLDLDRFKEINDTMGHAVGDQVLVEVARRIERAMRAHDTAARFGGDEFVALLTDLDGADEALHIADRLAERIVAPMRLDGHEHTVEVSIGIAISHSPDADPETLIQHADIAMYNAKRRRDVSRVLYTPEMQAGWPKLAAPEADSWHAITSW